ncbi:hypothetical protein AB0P40_15700 [Streptomyces sp. NPDC079189]|uniref:hypothetical protein n=1 Tax=Streptomyces sp. NPDC079189 TaxID=3154514 RepID=UPI0034463734
MVTDGSRRDGPVGERRCQAPSQGAGEVAAGFGEQVPVAEAAAVMNSDDGGDLQGCSGYVDDGTDGGADCVGGEVGQAQQVVDDRLADPGDGSGPPARAQGRQGLASLLLRRAGLRCGAGHQPLPDLCGEGLAGAAVALGGQFGQALHGRGVAGTPGRHCVPGLPQKPTFLGHATVKIEKTCFDTRLYCLSKVAHPGKFAWMTRLFHASMRG